MKLLIVSKLDDALKAPLSEAQVVYLLVELRKLLELRKQERRAKNEPKDHTYDTLLFCCDWAVHPVLNRESGRRIVCLFDRYHASMQSLQGGALPPNTTTAEMCTLMKEVSGLVHLEPFKQQFSDFLRSEGFDSSITDDAQKWRKFLQFYSQIIEECPLRCTGDNLQYVEEVVVRVMEVSASVIAGRPIELVFEWQWTSKADGGTVAFRSNF